jgi:hypothetical protein
LEGVTVVLIIVALLVVAALVVALVARRRAAGRADDTAPDDRGANSTTTARPDEPTDPLGSSAGPSTAAWDAVAGPSEGAPDPAGPPAAIHITVTGTHPWAPVRAFLSELEREGYVTTVELPDLVVLRDLERSPVTVREPAGPPGELIVTAAPEHMSDTLQTFVRSLLTGSFSVESTDGREVHLVDGDGTRIHLTVTELALT